MVNKTNYGLTLENELVEFVFGSKDGALRSARHKSSGQPILKMTGSMVNTRVWLGEGENLDAGQAVISSSSSQQAESQVLKYYGGTAVEITWRNLKDTSGNPTGIEFSQRYELDDDAEFLRIKTRFVNNGHFSITGLFIGLDGAGLVGDPDKEVLSMPNGTSISNPRKQLTAKVMDSLTCGWMDVSNGEIGLGIGYLNLKGMDYMREATFTNDGIKMGWRMFRLQGGWAFMEKHNGPLHVYPLRPGEEFTTDDWFISLHTGDWHKTANIYRQEYERVFSGDFLTWDKVSPAVKSADVIIADTAAWRKTSGPDNSFDVSIGEVKHKFLEIPGRVDSTIKKIGIDPANTLVVILGQTTHWGIYKLPDYFPVNAEAGGPADFNEMVRRLRKDIGIAGTHFYAHMAFNHPDADNFVAEADTGYDENLYTNYDHLGRVACTDSDEWFQLWKNKIIPGFVETGVNGLEVDEGAFHLIICSKPEHKHGNSSVSVLTAQSRGSLRILREYRKQLGPDGYLESEGGSDVNARHFDLWATGGKGKMELVRYTHPDKLMTIFVADTDDIFRTFVYGCPILRYVDNFDESFTKAAKMFAAERAKIREEHAPGYPNGFRDEDGLTITGSEVMAKIYADKNGATVAYYPKANGECTFEVDGRALGIAGLGTQKRTLTVKNGEIGYLVFKAK